MNTFLRTLIVALGLMLSVNVGWGQPWLYNFGTGTGTHPTNSVSTVFLSGTPSGGGTYRVRTGSAGGTIVLANPGTSLGTDSELQIQSSTSTSTNKLGIYDWTGPTTVGYLKCKIRTTSTTSGNLAISFGVNTIANDNQGYTSHYNNSLTTFVITYATGSISVVNRRISGSNVAISPHGFTKDGDHSIEIYCNNGASSTSYYRSGFTYILNSQTWDLWVDGTQRVTTAAKAGTLTAGTNLSGFSFFAESSTTNAAFFFIDDLEYSNVLPIGCSAPTTQASLITFSNVQPNQMDVSWTNGNGGNRIVVAKQGSNPDWTPVDGNDYTANASFGSGTQMGTGNYIVFDGSGNSVTVTNLSPSTTYHFKVFEYNCTGTSTVYNIANGATNNPNSQITGALVQPDWYNLQWPASGSIKCDNPTFNVYAQVYEAGVTEPAGQGANIQAWIGYNATDTDPSTWTNWVAASYSSDQGNNDEYIANLAGLAGGTYYYASRFQLSGGPYVYGGFSGGAWNGTTNVSGTLTVDAAADWCNIQFPENGSIILGGTFDVYGQVYESVVTEGAGQGANIGAWIGYSTVDNSPSANPVDWTWVAATYNPVVTGNNDEYMLALGSTLVTPGTYYYVTRFQRCTGEYVYGGYSGTGGGLWTNTFSSGTGNKSGRLIIINPTLSVVPSSLNGLDYPLGFGPSVEQTFVLSGSQLTGSDVTLTPPVNYEISKTSGAGFVSNPSSLTYTAYDGSNQTIYVRLAAGLAANTYTGNVVIAGGGDADGAAVALNGTVNAPSEGCAGDLFISEYYEGASNDKYIEIYNGTGSTVALGGYKISIYANGNTTPNSPEIVLNAVNLLDNGTYIIAHSSSQSAILANADQITTNVTFNGDDAVALRTTSDVIVDVIGVIGTDPGTEWGSGSTSTADNMLIRKNTITNGDTNGADAFDPATQWDGYANGNFTFMGAHTMNCPTYDTDSEASLPTGGQQAGGTISSMADTPGEAVAVFNFDLNDLGTTDLMGTRVINVCIKPGATNTADWTNTIQGITLMNGATPLSLGAVLISDTQIDIPPIFGQLDVANAGNETLTLMVYLNTSNIVDGSVLSFMIDANNHGFVADGDIGSTFASTFPDGDVVSNDFTITVDATELQFVQQPTGTVINVAMTPNPTVRASDANGNTDIDYSTAVSVSSDGTMTGDPVAGVWTSGVATFSGLTHTVLGTDLTLSASSGVLTGDVSSAFDIIEAPVYIAYQGFEDDPATPLDTWNYSGGTTSEVSSRFYSGIESLQIGGTSTVTFDNIIISGYDNVVLSVAFSATGCDSGDDLFMDISYNNGSTWTGTGSVKLVDGYSNAEIAFGDTNGSNPTTVATNPWTVNVDNAETQIAVRFRTTGLGAGEYYFIDEVQLDGQVVPCVPPTTHPSAMLFSLVNQSSMTVSWTNGDGASRIVVAKAGSAPTWTPTDGNTYTANASFGSGTELGSGNYVVYNGGSNSVAVSNLLPGTPYYYTVFEYNCSPGLEDYLVDQYIYTNSAYTLPGNVQNLSVSCITNTTVTLNWDAPAGGYEGILVAVRQGDTPVDPTCDGSTLVAANADFSAAQLYCGNGALSYYVFNGTGNTVTITDLTNASSYTFKVFTWNGSDWSNGTQLTRTVDLPEVSNVNVTRGNAYLNVSWSKPLTCYDEIMVVGHAGGSVTAVPSGDGSLYNADAFFGNGTDLGGNDFVVYKGTGNAVTVTNLVNGTNHCFTVFVRNGIEWSTGVEGCETPLNITIIEPGDLMILAVNTNFDNDPLIVPGQPIIGFEEFTFVCYKEILEGTPIDFTENGYEREIPPAVTDYGRWGTTEGTIRLTRAAGAGNLPAGVTVTVVMNEALGGAGIDINDFDIFVGGSDELATGDWTIEMLNTTNGTGFNLNAVDDIWIMQNGSWLENDVTGGSGDESYQDDEYTGNVLYGWTASGWGVGTGTELSQLYPYSDCFQTDVSAEMNNSKVKYIGATTPATQLEWIARVNNKANWGYYASDAAYDAASPLYRQSGLTIVINASVAADGIWTGSKGSDWFDCGNWLSLTVPDETIDVSLANTYTENDALVNDLSLNAAKYDGIAMCQNLTISDQTLILQGDVNDVLEVHGNLTINTGGLIDMDDESIAADGNLYLYGNWNNTVGDAAFLEGNGTVRFVGTAGQSITTAGSNENFADVVLNNNSPAGVSLANDIMINGAFTHTDGTLNLNGNDLELRGIYGRTTGSFIGNSASNFSITNVGTVADINFLSNTNLFDFTINRADEEVNVISDLTVGGTLSILSGSLSLAPARFYTVSGTISNTVGTTGLIIRSDASGTASLIHSTAGIAATCERFLTADNWHYLFTPLNDANISIYTTTSWGADNPNFYWYDETVGDFWEGSTVYNPTGWTAPSHAGKILTDRGYIQQSPEDYVYALTGGTLDVSDKDYTLSYTDHGVDIIEPNTGFEWDYFDGWNLFGNPYTSAVDWNHAGVDKDNIENFIYYYDDINDNYICVGAGIPWDNSITVNGGTPYIPANQGFFVKAIPTGNGQNFTIPSAARVHNGQPFYKGEEKEIIPNMLRLQIEKDGYTDEIIVRTTGEATIDHDPMFDAYKMFAWNNTKPQLYSRNAANSNIYAVNSLPEVIGHTVVPLGVQIGVSGEYCIRMTENNFDGMHVWLEDALLEEDINLRENPNYSFPIAAELNAERFYLHIGQNNAPTLNASIPDQEIFTGEAYSYEVPTNLFSDADITDHLTVTADLGKGKSLPAWLSFDAETMTFSGTPSEVETLNIVVIATDVFGAQVSDSFVLNVKSLVNVNDITGSVSVYPNPAEDRITVALNGIEHALMTMTDVNGKIVLQQSLNGEKTHVDLSTMAKGIYFIKIISDQGTFNQKMMVR